MKIQVLIKGNAFAGTFAFLPTLQTTLKKQKSLQATAQGQCKLDTADKLKDRRAAHNMNCVKKQEKINLN